MKRQLLNGTQLQPPAIMTTGVHRPVVIQPRRAGPAVLMLHVDSLVRRHALKSVMQSLSIRACY